MKNNGLKIVGSVLLGAFVLYNIFWLYSVNKIYAPYKKAIGCSIYLSSCMKQEEGYTYGVNSPSYLSHVGNLFITEEITVEEDGSSNATCDLLIWPLRNGGYEFGVSILSGTVKGSDNVSVDMMLDENMQLIGSYDEDVVILYQNSLDKIKSLYALADEKWEIFE